jgi:hypothetical protein
MKNNRFYVYCHRKKTDGKCFYIGKGTGYRYSDIGGRNQYWKNIVNKHGFTWEILINNISEKKAFELEALICNKIGYDNLCNLNQEKGNGGWTISNEQKIQRSLIRKGKPKPEGFGKNHSEKMKGRKRSSERNKKISQKLIGQKHSKETKQKISKALIGKPKSQEHIKNMKKPKPKGFGEMLSKQRKGKIIIPQHQIEAGIQAKNKPTIQYDKQGNFITEYPSSKIAAQSIGVHEVNMRSHLGGKYKTCKGFIFKYKT